MHELINFFNGLDFLLPLTWQGNISVHGTVGSEVIMEGRPGLDFCEKYWKNIAYNLMTMGNEQQQ